MEIDRSELPVSECRRFQEILEEIKPASVTLIFPAAHINSPASMFGHTLLTVDTASGSRLLAQAINYSAVTRETFGPLFAFKGLFGFYPGYFSVLPYYAKLQEYSDIEHRDIWEYPLNLNGEEVKRLLMHTFEMDRIYSDYYFFDENCSYTLLFLLDSARPSLGLTDQLPLWVIPIDTIRKVKETGLVTRSHLPPVPPGHDDQAPCVPASRSEWKISRGISVGRIDPDILLEEKIAPERKIVICDLAAEHLQYQYSRKDMSRENSRSASGKSCGFGAHWGERKANMRCPLRRGRMKAIFRTASAWGQE